jgi:hypothetical protein
MIRLPYRLPSADHQHYNLTSLAELILQNHVAPWYNATDIGGACKGDIITLYKSHVQ